jgi:hypothetical protein
MVACTITSMNRNKENSRGNIVSNGCSLHPGCVHSRLLTACHPFSSIERYMYVDDIVLVTQHYP